jgi:putative DNA primase/helicase
MTIDVEGLKARTDIVAVVGSYVQLRKRGAEYVGLCPFHADNNPSFWVSPAKKFCHCFVCDANHDVISFVREMDGLDFQAACAKLGAENWKPVNGIKHEKAAVKAERVSSKPPDPAPPDMTLRGLGTPSVQWEYKDAGGELLFYVCRYEEGEGKKQFRAWTWGVRDGEEAKWACAHWDRGSRPLYGLDRLARRPEAPVLVVEGEKAADAAQKLLPQYVAITWPGGAQAWKHADWSPVRGRRVDLWPDNDKAGRDAMEGVRGLISTSAGLDCYGKIIDPRGIEEGGDAADWPGGDIMPWLKERATWYREKGPHEPPPEAAMPPPPPPPPPDEPPPVDVGGDDDEDCLPASMSEDMLAERFAEQHARAWRYVKPWGSWFEWREDGWYKDDTAKIDHLAVLLTRQAIYWKEAQQLTTDQKRRINCKRTAGAVRDIALTHRRIAATVDQWDTNTMLLGVPGGVVDLRTGKLQVARPEDYVTKRAKVAPAEGDAPIWRSFLETVTGEDGELIAFLQRFGGYSLTGETREQCLAFLYGTGQNGKGVFITTLSRILGDYAVSSDADVFMESDHQRHPTEMARLRGARLVYVDETDGSKRWNEKRIKRVTGGGRIEAHFMRQDDFEFDPQFKLLIAGNHKPQLRGVGKAIQRRIHLVPFTVTIPDHQRDDKLVQKLEAEYPQILHWLVQGCLAWQEQGLRAPEKVAEATSRYIEGEDVIGEWLEERTEQSGSCERPAAYKNYKSWAEGRGERSWSTKAFWGALEERGFQLRRTKTGRYIDNLSLRLEAPSDEQPGYQY